MQDAPEYHWHRLRHEARQRHGTRLRAARYWCARFLRRMATRVEPR